MSEYQKNGSFVPLEEVDASSVVIGEVTMLNTLKHYQVRNVCRSGVDFFLGEALLTPPNFGVSLRLDNQIASSVPGLSYKTVEETRTEAHNRRTKSQSKTFCTLVICQ